MSDQTISLEGDARCTAEAYLQASKSEALKCISSPRSRVCIVEYIPLLPWGSSAILVYRLPHSLWYPPSAVEQFDLSNVPTVSQSLVWVI